MSPCVNNGRGQVFFGTTVSALPPPTTHKINPEALLIQANEKTKQSLFKMTQPFYLKSNRFFKNPKKPTRQFGIYLRQ